MTVTVNLVSESIPEPDQVEHLDAGVLERRLLAEGFVQGKPPWVKKDCLAIDREVAMHSPCDCCGHAGLRFFPWHHSERPNYVAVAVCPQCDHAVEF